MRLQLVLKTALLVLVAACNATSVTDNVQVASVELAPNAVNVRAGTDVPLAATLRDGNGKLIDGRNINWSTSNVSVATVSATGLVKALAPGQARIAASSMGKSATVNVVVTAAEVAAVQVTPPSVEVRTGNTAQLAAKILDPQDNEIFERVVTWTSSNSSVATVNAQGIVTGVATGAATITATCEGRTGSSAVTVSAVSVATVAVTPTTNTLRPGEAVQLTATARDAGGAILTGRTVTWNSSNALLASVSSTGRVSAVAPGTVTITATVEGKAGTAPVVVQAASVGLVTLSPGSNTVITGATVQLTAQVTDASGNVLTGRPISYTSTSNPIATVSATGLVTGVAVGQVTITATSEGRSGTAIVRVVAVPVAAVTLSPPAPSILAGATLQLAATVTSAAGVPLTGRTVAWTSGATGLATVSASGLVTAIAPGVVVIFAESEGIRGSATITITQAAVNAVTITPAAPSILVNAMVQLTATPRDRNGVALTNRVITWKSEDESVAFVSSTGAVIGLKAGAVFITATSEGVSGSTLVTVR